MRRSKHSILEKSIQRISKLPLFKNGHRKFHSKSESTLVYNTCAVDTCFQVFVALYTDYKSMKSLFEVDNSTFCNMVVSAARKPKPTISVYASRDSLIRTIYADQVVKSSHGLIAIDCLANITYVIERALPECLHSYVVKKSCTVCPMKVISRRVFLDLDSEKLEEDREAIKNLKTHVIRDVKSLESESNCHSANCNGKIIKKLNLSKSIIIDLQPCKVFSIDQIPKVLEIKKSNYNLHALIQYIKGKNQETGHYIAHVRRSNGQYEKYDDTSNKVTKSSCNKKLEFHVVFYVQSENEQ